MSLRGWLTKRRLRKLVANDTIAPDCWECGGMGDYPHCSECGMIFSHSMNIAMKAKDQQS